MLQYDVPFSEFNKIFASFQTLYEAHALDNTLPYDGLYEAVKALKSAGIRLAVHTNKPDVIAKNIVEHLFPDCFSCILGQREGFALKPDPMVAQGIAAEFAIAKGQCAFCGDSDVDINTAKAAGMPSIGVTWGFRSKSELINAGADYIADKPEDIQKIICGY